MPVGLVLEFRLSIKAVQYLKRFTSRNAAFVKMFIEANYRRGICSFGNIKLDGIVKVQSDLPGDNRYSLLVRERSVIN